MAVSTGTALIGSAVAGGLASSSAASKAAKAQRGAARSAADVQMRMFEQNREDLAPWRDAGALGLAAQMDMLGLNSGRREAMDSEISRLEQEIAQAQSQPQETGGGPQGGYDPNLQPIYGGPNPEQPVIIGWRGGETSAPSGNVNRLSELRTQLDQLKAQRASLGDRYDWQASPGYEFTRSEGLRGMDSRLGAMGMRNSGRALKALTQYTTGLASGEFDNQFNRLGAIAGTGQTAGNTLAQLGANTASNVGNAYMQAGNAAAAGRINQANAFTGMLGDMAYGWGNRDRGGSGILSRLGSTPYVAPASSLNIGRPF